MIGFLLRKSLYAFLVIAGVVTVSFLLNFSLPGDPARLMLGQHPDEESLKALRAQYDLDKPLPYQYKKYWENLLQLDLGRSYSNSMPVTEIIAERFPATALLSLTAMVIATLFGIAFGLLSALKPNSWSDNFFIGLSVLGISLPVFITGVFLQLAFSIWLDWFPLTGDIMNGVEFLVLPAIALGVRPMSIIARVTRSSMLDVLGQDYIRTARAKGQRHFIVVVKHGLRNAINPVITTIGAAVAGLLSGAYFVESVFNIPGLGGSTFNAIEKLDYPLISGSILFAAIIFVVVNVLVDVLYAVFDPKVRIA